MDNGVSNDMPIDLYPVGAMPLTCGSSNSLLNRNWQYRDVFGCLSGTRRTGDRFIAT
jgi:hypothetical protein